MLIYLTMLDSDEERQTFRSIYHRNYKNMYHRALGILKNEEDAEDVVHHAFLILAERFDKYKKLEDKKMDALCIIIIKHLSINIYQRKKYLSDEEIENCVLVDEEILNQPELAYIEKEQNQNIRSILEQLPELLKEVLDLRYFYDMSNKEIAKLLNIPVKTVEMRVYRAKIKLKELMKNEFSE